MNFFKLVLAITIPKSTMIQGEKPTALWFDSYVMGGIDAVKELGVDHDFNNIWEFTWEVPKKYLTDDILSTDRLNPVVSKLALTKILEGAHGSWLKNSLEETFGDQFTISIAATIQECGEPNRLATFLDFQEVAFHQAKIDALIESCGLAELISEQEDTPKGEVVFLGDVIKDNKRKLDTLSKQLKKANG